MVMACVAGAVLVSFVLAFIVAFWSSSQLKDHSIAVTVTNRTTTPWSIEMEIDGKPVAFPAIRPGQTVSANVRVRRDAEGGFGYKLIVNQRSVQSGSLGYWDNFTRAYDFEIVDVKGSDTPKLTITRDDR